MSIRGEAAIVGFYELPTLRHYGPRSVYSLMAEVTRGAIRDAGLRKEDIDGLINAEGINSLTASQALGIKPRYTASMTTHGASGATSIATAAAVIAAGLANYVLCVFCESRPPSTSRLAGATNPRGGGGPASIASEWEAPFGPVVAMNGPYALIKQRHMFQFGTQQEQFAKCAVDQRFNALLNENALWKGQPTTIEDVLNSRYTNDPLHLLECVMPVSGGAACIVTSAERARALPVKPVYILGVGGPATRHDDIWSEEDVVTSPVVLSAPTAFKMSGYNVRDMQFAEFYDCYTILVMMCLEDAGICPKGEIGPFYQSTDTTYKGSFPINTDGGQISGGQPGNAGGFRHVIEATRQVMGRAGARQVARYVLF
ncbi:MAG: thiolase family protein, partial [Chloroflexi bacterium]|nr:thiolase family protein [Chloroflexota bacterium]